MAFDRKPLNLSGSFNTSQKGTLIKCFDQVAAGTVVPQTAPTNITGQTGTAGSVIADVGGSFTQATLNSNFRVVSDKINAVIAALKTAGVMS